jgi:16S rRNA (cytosine1402-N4)-methyltransferase
VDGTLGLGGHTEKLLQSYSGLRVLGLEWDASALRIAQQRLESFGDRFEGLQESFVNLSNVLTGRGVDHVDGVLLDLGLSSMQLKDASRGFSFLKSGPLDMRMSATLPRTAWNFIERLSARELADLFKKYGEEPRARRVAQALKDALEKGTLSNDAWQVASCIRRVIPTAGKGLDPATRCFQALRIAVNEELDNVGRFLSDMKSVLRPGGRAAIISFHSLEDRLVKRAFQQAAKGCVCPPQSPMCVCGQKPWASLLPRKAIQPAMEEIAKNPRARSARLRILEKL